MKKNIGISVLIVLLLVVISLISKPVYAETIGTEPSGIGTEELGATDIIVTSDPISIKALVPIKLLVHLEETGEIITSTEHYIQNLSAAGGIKVVNIQLNTKNSWILEDFTYPDYKNLPVNSKIYGFQIFNDNADPNTGLIPLNSEEWVVIPSAGMIMGEDEGGNITYKDNIEALENRLYLNYDARVGAQSSVLPETAIGGVIFTIDFDYVD